MTAEQDRKVNSGKRVRVRGEAFVGKVRELIHEGNVRHLVIKNDHGRTVMEIPVTAGVVAAVAAPVVTAVGAIAALAREWTIEVHTRSEEAATAPARDEYAGDEDAVTSPDDHNVGV